MGRPSRGRGRVSQPDCVTASQEAKPRAAALCIFLLLSRSLHSPPPVDDPPTPMLTFPSQTATHLPKVVDQAAGGQYVDRAQVLGASGIVVVAVDGEHGQGHIIVGVLVVHPAALALGCVGVLGGGRG